MRKITIILVIALLFVLVGCKDETIPEESIRIMKNHSVYQDGINYEDELWQKPQFYEESSLDRVDANIKAVWIRSDYLGLESYAFSYLGMPENPSGKAILLLHGGGGTAYYEWVQRWMDFGFIALAIDLGGHVPTVTGNLNSYPYDLYTKSPYTTPTNKNYNDASLPIEETWMHYATRTAIIANSFLHNLEGVDPYQIGVSGISWGGVITSIITGYDNRFAFSIPIYSTLNQVGTDSSFSSYYEKNPAAKVWDDDKALSLIETPIHFVVSNVDRSGRLDSSSKTLSRTKNGSMTVLKDLLHAHSIAVDVIEPYTFANKIINKEELVTFDSKPDFSQTSVTLSIPENTTIDQSFIVYSTDIKNISASWSKRNISLEGTNLTYVIPEGTTMFYISVVDTFGNTWSSELIEKN